MHSCNFLSLRPEAFPCSTVLGVSLLRNNIILMFISVCDSLSTGNRIPYSAPSYKCA
ncbi:hypothetical protein ACUY4Q_000979 [Phytobacter sp. AG2a]